MKQLLGTLSGVRRADDSTSREGWGKSMRRRCVLWMSAWPSSSCTVLTSTPLRVDDGTSGLGVAVKR